MKQKRRPSLMVLCLTGSVTGCGGGSDSVGPSGPPAPAPTVASVVVTPATTTFATAGETVQLRASAFEANGNMISGKTFTWSSSSMSVATVSSSGLVTAVANGSATISAATDGVTGTAAINVTGRRHGRSNAFRHHAHLLGGDGAAYRRSPFTSL